MIIKLFNSLFIAIIIINTSIKNNIVIFILYIHIFNSLLIKTFYYAIFITNTEVKLLVIRHNIN